MPENKFNFPKPFDFKKQRVKLDRERVPAFRPKKEINKLEALRRAGIYTILTATALAGFKLKEVEHQHKAGKQAPQIGQEQLHSAQSTQNSSKIANTAIGTIHQKSNPEMPAASSVKKSLETNQGQEAHPVHLSPLVEPLTEAWKIFIPGMPALEYWHLMHEKQAEIEHKKAEGREHSQEALESMADQLEIISEIVYKLAQEEIYTENVVIYLVTLVSLFYSGLTEWLFFALVGKAKITTAVINKLKDTVVKTEESIGNYFKKLSDKYKSSEEEFIDSLLAEKALRQGKQPENKDYKSKLQWIFSEVQLLRRGLTQIKIALQAPIFYSHSKNATYVYQALVDSASPRFTHLLQSKEAKKAGHYDTVLQSNILVGEQFEQSDWQVWQAVLTSMNRKGEKFLPALEKYLHLLNPEMTKNSEYTDNRYYYKRWPLVGDKFGYEDMYTTMSRDYYLEVDEQNSTLEQQMIANENTIGNTERIDGMFDYYGIENTTKLKLVFEIMKSLMNELALRITPEQIAQIREGSLWDTDNVLRQIEQYTGYKSGTYENLSKAKPDYSIDTLNWQEIGQYLYMLAPEEYKGFRQSLHELIFILNQYDLPPSLFISDQALARNHFAFGGTYPEQKWEKEGEFRVFRPEMREVTDFESTASSSVISLLESGGRAGQFNWESIAEIAKKLLEKKAEIEAERRKDGNEEKIEIKIKWGAVLAKAKHLQEIDKRGREPSLTCWDIFNFSKEFEVENHEIDKPDENSQWTDRSLNLKMPTWAKEYNSIFDPRFLNFLNHYRFKSDMTNLFQSLGSKNDDTVLSIDQRLNQIFARVKDFREFYQIADTLTSGKISQGVGSYLNQWKKISSQLELQEFDQWKEDGYIY